MRLRSLHVPPLVAPPQHRRPSGDDSPRTSATLGPWCWAVPGAVARVLALAMHSAVGTGGARGTCEMRTRKRFIDISSQRLTSVLSAGLLGRPSHVTSRGHQINLTGWGRSPPHFTVEKSKTPPCSRKAGLGIQFKCLDAKPKFTRNFLPPRRRSLE